MKTKLCSNCKKVKNTEEFYADNRNTTGYSSYCKKCAKKAQYKRKHPRKMKTTTKAHIISSAIYFTFFFFFYGTDYAIRNAKAGLELFERVNYLDTVSRAVLAGSELVYIGFYLCIFGTVYFILTYKSN